MRSERLACMQACGALPRQLSPSTRGGRYDARTQQQDRRDRADASALCYRRILDMLRPHFPGVNHKKGYRLYSAANLAVRKRKKVKRPAATGHHGQRGVAHGLRQRQPEHGTAYQMPDRGRRLQPRGREPLGGLGHLRSIRHAPARSGGRLQRLPAGCAHRQRPGVHQSRLHGMGADAWHPPHPDRAGKAHAERLHRALQRQVPGRAPQRAMVRDAATGPIGHHALAPRLQRGQTAQQLPANAAGEVRRVASPARWRCNSIHISNH